MRNGRWLRSSRAFVENDAFQLVRLTAGGVAPMPIRLPMAEAAAQGAFVSPATVAAAARAAKEGARPLPMTGYKLELLAGLVQDLLEQCSA
jgi:xanthine dehydrogenase YagS FAD-binding subunit